VILNGVAMERFDAQPTRRQEARAALGLPPDAPVIGAVGRMVALKNHRALIQLMPSLLAAFPDLRLVLAGDGPLRGALQEQALQLGVAHVVRFLGERSDVSSILPAFDVFALPSLTEGLSIALLEAAACGLAIVASNTGGNPEIVMDGVRGVLFPVGEVDALGQAVHALLRDEALRRQLGDNARSWVLANGSISATCRAYHHCYLAALSSAGRHSAVGSIAT
jgi:glycosyltransferase involved in cell wall biosynthesis